LIEGPIRVHAPATSANLGPGFDCLGVTLDLWNDVEARPGHTGPASDNLILRAAQRVFDEVGAPNPGFLLECTNRIPFSRGLGSSAAAIVSGVLLANHYLGNPLTQRDCLHVAAHVEGHPDNVTPCVLGGIRVAVRNDVGELVECEVPCSLRLCGVVFVPDVSVATTDARRVLPSTVARQDALFNVARSSLLVAALAAGRPDLLAEATRDRLHQPFREPLFPPSATLQRTAMQAGALGACTSGAGPSVLALCDGPDAAERVRCAFEATARECDVSGSVLKLALTTRGAYVD
jgi:homoserine kinase